MFSVPPIELKMAPPPTALLPVNVESVTVRSPLLRTPPPLPVELPLEIVRSFRVSVPVRLRKMRLALPPSISIVWPLPSISRTPVGDGSVLATINLPLKLKTIVSLAVPATQSPLVVSDPLLELVIASRRLHTPSPAVLESESVLTVIVLAACSELRRVRTDSTVSRTSAANTVGRTIPLAKRRAAAGRLTPLPTDAFTLGPPCFVKQGWALPLSFDFYPSRLRAHGPVPVRLMMCGLVGSLPTVTDMLALSADPPAVGVKVTAIVQAEFGDAVVVQVLVGEIVKSDPLGPLMPWANDSGNPDRLVTVLVFVGVLEVSVPYASVAGRTVSGIVGPVLSATVYGASGSGLSETDSVADSVPSALGEKCTIIEHAFSAPRLEVQVPPPTVKSPGLAPLKLSLNETG